METVTETYANGITRTYTPVICSGCEAPTDPLALFPRDLCLDCYRGTPEANRPLTASDIVSMWTSPNLINL